MPHQHGPDGVVRERQNRRREIRGEPHARARRREGLLADLAVLLAEENVLLAIDGHSTDGGGAPAESALESPLSSLLLVLSNGKVESTAEESSLQRRCQLCCRTDAACEASAPKESQGGGGWPLCGSPDLPQAPDQRQSPSRPSQSPGRTRQRRWDLSQCRERERKRQWNNGRHTCWRQTAHHQCHRGCGRS